MLRSLPKFEYSGLTIILSNPSRHDKLELLAGAAGDFIENECLRPETVLGCCDIRLIDDPSPIIKNTKCILLCGVRAFNMFTNAALSIDEGRGSPYERNGIICIPTFNPQDAVDIKDFESTNNELLNGSREDEMDSDELDAGELFASKGRGRTARSNYRFWVKNDIKKCLKIINNNGTIPQIYNTTPTYSISPSLDNICRRLNAARNLDFYFDMETDFTTMDMRCFAFSFSDDPFYITTVPTLTTNYKPFYGKDQKYLHKSLLDCISNNITVAHNGSQFDYFVLAYKYRIAISKVYDTLIAAHRIYPVVEKSLGHWISLCTFEPFHKNEGAHGYFNQEQAWQLYKYCGKDVFTMYLVKKWQDEMAAKDEGLKASIDLAMRAIKPYLTATILGMKFNQEKIKEQLGLNDRLMMQYLRIIKSLTGGEVLPLISNQKCTKYFHDQLGYPIVARTPNGGPSLAEDSLYKLALKVKNPVIDFLIKYRQVQKESGCLNFNPWIK